MSASLIAVVAAGMASPLSTNRSNRCPSSPSSTAPSNRSPLFVSDGSAQQSHGDTVYLGAIEKDVAYLQIPPLNDTLSSVASSSSISTSRRSHAASATSTMAVASSTDIHENTTNTAILPVASSQPSTSSLLTVNDVKPPLPPFPIRRIPPNVLSEEDYVAALTDIVERDYFPDLPRLRTLQQLQQAEAAEDYAASSRLEKALQSVTPSVSVSQTRHRLSGPTSHLTPLSQTYDTASNVDVPTAADTQIVQLQDGSLHKLQTNCSLDTFQAMYTSEDNLSFEELTNQEKRRKQEAQSWIEGAEYTHNRKTAEIHELTLEGKKSLYLATNTFTARNALLFSPIGEPNEEQPYYARMRMYEHLDAHNSRFRSTEKEAEALLVSRVDQMDKKKDLALVNKQKDRMVLEGKFRSDFDSVRDSPYSFVHPLTLHPGVGPDQSPLMTWGKVASTPLVLSNAETYEDHEGFKMPDPLPREKVAEKLQNAASQKVKSRKRQKQMDHLYGFYGSTEDMVGYGASASHRNYMQKSSGRSDASPAVQSAGRLRELAEKSPLVRQIMRDQSQPINMVDQQLRNAYSGRKGTGFLSGGSRIPTGYGTSRQASQLSLVSPMLTPTETLLSESPLKLQRSSSQFSQHSLDSDKSEGVAYVQKHIYTRRNAVSQSFQSHPQADSTKTSDKSSTIRDEAADSIAVTDNLLHI